MNNHLQPEKLEYPDLPPESYSEGFKSNKKPKVVSDKRKLGDTIFLEI